MIFAGQRTMYNIDDQITKQIKLYLHTVLQKSKKDFLLFLCENDALQKSSRNLKQVSEPQTNARNPRENLKNPQNLETEAPHSGFQTGLKEIQSNGFIQVITQGGNVKLVLGNIVLQEKYKCPVFIVQVCYYEVPDTSVLFTVFKTEP